MKKLMFSVAAVAIISAASYVALRSSNSEREFSDLELANIEALTEDETGKGDVILACNKNTSVYMCIVKCSICGDIWGSVSEKGYVVDIKGKCECGSHIFLVPQP